MNEKEGRELAALPKWGQPKADWAQGRPNTLTNTFGVVDAQGKGIKGVHVEIAVYISPILALRKFVLSLQRVEFGVPERAYQLEINTRGGLMPTDHAYSHEHFGRHLSGRAAVSPELAAASFEAAVAAFCERCNLKLTEPLSHYQELKLK